MKVLFAVNNDEISEAIVKKYQKEYKEIITYKNVYYFNAILKELQRDNTYDRIVISEDLEPFANNNYDTIDKFLFEKLDKISDEANEKANKEVEIILICTDRRTKSDSMLTKIFGIGVYSAIIGQDRTIDAVCKLINTPRTKKDAKMYYKIEIDNVMYEQEDENNVSEAELQNIIAHYKRLGRNEDKYVDSFNSIVSQYNDIQLKIIIKYLPINVRAVLEQRSQKYQELATFLGSTKTTKYTPTPIKDKEQAQQDTRKQQNNVNIIDTKLSKPNTSKPILIPKSVNTSEVKKLIKKEEKATENIQDVNVSQEVIQNVDAILDTVGVNKEPVIEQSVDAKKPEEVKRGRGRPHKQKAVVEEKTEEPKRGRGRPPKKKQDIIEEKQKSDENDDILDLFEMNQEQDQQNEDIDLFNISGEDNQEDESDNINLFEQSEMKEKDNSEELNLFDLDETEEENINTQISDNILEDEEEEIIPTQEIKQNVNLSSVLTKDKKLVAFVGTTKNGTSFVVNNLADLMSNMGIDTAILDTTKSKNAYYIYTNNEERLRQIASTSITKLKSGIANGVPVNKKLTVYTSLPEEKINDTDIESILETLVQNYSLVLIDCDFDTPIEYFANVQEIYLVQSMDVLTIQPLTAFLRNLKSKGVLKQEKLKVVINKEQKVRNLSDKVLIGGISCYNDPSMSYMTELFDKDKISFCTIPFEAKNYAKYLEYLTTCSISINGYTNNLKNAFKNLANLVYPLISRQTYSPRGSKYQDNFSDKTNDTLNKMKRELN